MLPLRLAICLAFLLTLPLGPGAAFAQSKSGQANTARQVKKPAPKPRRNDWANTQANLECPPPARPACGR